MLDLEENTHGVLLPVQAQPKARQNAITGLHAGQLKVSVTQAPEKGKANAAIAKVLAKELDLRKSQVHLHSGETSSQKRFLITDVTRADLQQRITEHLASNG